MKLIQQSKLFFKEGNSDKVYEIDLCELSPDEYLVNFRYGKRGSALKEGTKTPAAVTKERAGVLFAELENEKRKKGYQTETEMFMELPSLDAVEPKSVKGTILQRLQDAVEGKNSFKTVWKTSRVIWKAATLELEEAIPFIIKLASKGDAMQAYAALWALVRLRAVQAEPVFNAYAANIKQKPYIRNLAKEGLLTVTSGDALEKLSAQLTGQLPAEVRYAIEMNDAALLASRLMQDTRDGNIGYVTDLYLLGKVHGWLLPVLYEVLKTWAFRPPYFRQIRAVYKLAQLRKDAAVISLLSYRFEKEPYMFKRTASLDSNYRNFINAINQSVRVGAELKSEESKLAFSQFTKTYFQKNAVAFLQDAGKGNDAKSYIRLAVATLLQYKDTDYTPAEEKPLSTYGQYDYKTRNYTFTLVNYPECAGSLLLSTILFGNDTARILLPNLKFIIGQRSIVSKQYYYSPEIDHTPVSDTSATGNTASAPTTPVATGNPVINAAVNVFKSLFGKKAADTTPQKEEVTIPPVADISVNVPASPRYELFPEHWDAMPEAYVQLLMQAQMEIIHRFAYHNLIAHDRFEELGNRFDRKALLQLLSSDFEWPSELGFEVLKRRSSEFERDAVFVGDVLNSNNIAARQWAQALVVRDPGTYLNDIAFVLQLIFNRQPGNKEWISQLLQQHTFSTDRQQAITGKTVAELLHLDNTVNNNELAKLAIARLNWIAGAQMERISWDIVTQLIASPLEANKILAGDMLISKSKNVAPEDIPLSLAEVLLQHELPEVRKNGVQLFDQYPDGFLEKHIGFVLALADSSYADVVSATLVHIRKLVDRDPQQGNTALQHLVYVLIRKEQFEGAHAMVSNFVVNELKPYWNSGLRPHDVTRLIHAHYRIGQLTGYDILKTYDKTGEFTLGQIISFGNHELLAIRQWCWNYFKQHAERIRQERDKALNLLDAKWDDTRAYAFHFFKTTFTEADWDTGTLIGIADSIRPDVEAFGKELITLYFRPEHAVEYLTKLSEHPGLNIQGFVTSYLDLYAADKPELLEQLDFYFRSVLTRVNKGRVAKDRVFRFLHREALKNREAAAYVATVIDDIAVQATIQDKATGIHILTDIRNHYPDLQMHLTIKN